jgi:hypothetical protein
MIRNVAAVVGIIRDVLLILFMGIVLALVSLYLHHTSGDDGPTVDQPCATAPANTPGCGG